MALYCWPARNVCLQGSIPPFSAIRFTEMHPGFHELYIWSCTVKYILLDERIESVSYLLCMDISFLRIYELYLNCFNFMKHMQNSLPEVLITMCFPLYSCSVFISCYSFVRSRCSIFPMVYILEKSTWYQVCSTEQLGKTKKGAGGDCHCVSVLSSNALLGLFFWEKSSSSLHM